MFLPNNGTKLTLLEHLDIHETLIYIAINYIHTQINFDSFKLYNPLLYALNYLVFIISQKL